MEQKASNISKYSQKNIKNIKNNLNKILYTKPRTKNKKQFENT